MTQYCYIVQEREFIRLNEPTYKIGKTTQSFDKRFGQYPNGSVAKIMKSVDNCHKCEKVIIKIFDEKFKKMVYYGNEYYQGVYVEMEKEFLNIVDNYEKLYSDYFGKKHDVVLEKHKDRYDKFIADFFPVNKNSYDDVNMRIDFEVVAKWLSTSKSHLKRILDKHFTIDKDYNVTKLTKISGKTNANRYNEIKITPYCLKELCVLSLTPNAKHMRSYLTRLEKSLIK